MIFNSILFTWNEEDIIESSVLNAFAQGCDNVYIIDNGSTDNTIENALKAGAKLVCKKITRYFDEREKICQLNSFVQYYNSQCDENEIWWMYFDADEFMSTHNDATIRELLSQIDYRIRALKGYFYDHIPSYPPYNVEGYHPIDFMPECRISSTYKIPIIKYVKGENHIFSAGGAHEIDTNGQDFFICENAIAIHHFQYRRPDTTLKRLKMLLPRLYWMDKRSELIYKTRKSMYHSRYENCKQVYKDNLYSTFKKKNLCYQYNNIRRWYDIYNDCQFSSINHDDALLCKAFYYYFMEIYDISLCRFNDLLTINRFSKYFNWISVKIADCFSHSDKSSSDRLYSSLIKTNNNDIIEYINMKQPVNNFNCTLKIERYASKFAIDKNVILNRMSDIIKETCSYSYLKI